MQSDSPECEFLRSAKRGRPVVRSVTADVCSAQTICLFEMNPCFRNKRRRKVEISILDKHTIDQIAAGEVVERPASVVKELVENAVDAKATAVTVEIKDGGTTLIRITDNGSGIEKGQIRIAFARHATSKIRSAEDLTSIDSLGFRGEALSSIASVSRVELITKTRGELTGCRYLIEGGEETAFEEVGAPDGTTFLVRDLFYNTPARRKFLKTAAAEAGQISDLMERMALSNPEVSFQFINNGQVRLHTSGNGAVKDIIYHVYGRDITANLLEIGAEFAQFSVKGYLGKPVISRGNRNFENYFVNGRYVKSGILARAIEDGYKGFMMQHKYPFTVLYLTLHGDQVDVNVHPAKMELRFSNGEEIYWKLSNEIAQVLKGKELIPEVTPGSKKKETPGQEKKPPAPEPFEEKRLEEIRRAVAKDSPYEKKYPAAAGRTGHTSAAAAAADARTGKKAGGREPARFVRTGSYEAELYVMDSGMQDLNRENSPEKKLLREKLFYGKKEPAALPPGGEKGTETPEPEEGKSREKPVPPEEKGREKPVPSEGRGAGSPAPSEEKERAPYKEADTGRQEPEDSRQTGLIDLLPESDRKLLDENSVPEHRIIGQVFETYWLVEFEDKLYLIDQHAAHEKVLYERMMADYKKKEFTSQQILPPMVLSLTMKEEELLKKYLTQFTALGFEIEPFGGREYAIRAVPDNLYGLNGKELFLELVDSLEGIPEKEAPELVVEKVAGMSCKAAVKGNSKLSSREAQALIAELLTLENPYHCPHGRPVIISMSRYEIEKKFKRIV